VRPRADVVAPRGVPPLSPARLAFLASLVALVAALRGMPSPASLLAVALALALGIGARALPERRRSPLRELRLALMLVVLLVAGALVLMALGERGPLVTPWVTLVGVPFALALTREEPTLVPRSKPLAWLLLASLAAGVVGLAPWTTRTGSALLAVAALLGTYGAALDLARAAPAKGMPAPTSRERRRGAATAALVALAVILLAAAVDAALAQLPRPWRDPEGGSNRSDRLARQLPVPERAAPRQAGLDGGVALVRLLEGDEPPPARLFLRESVLDLPVEREGVLFLGPRGGESLDRRDADDGREDQRVHWTETRDEPNESGLAFQVTLLADPAEALLVVPRPRWLDGAIFTIAADGSIARPTSVPGSFTYRTGGSPAAAFGPPPRPPARAAAQDHDDEQLALPPAFEGRVVLAAMLRDVPEGEDDHARAEAIASMLRRTGRFDPAAPFEDWAGFGAARRGSSLHFAQCFALLARIARLPARVACGYATSAFDEKDRRWDVRRGDRRFWGEVRFEEIGWAGFDPLPAAPPAEAAPPPPRTDSQALRTTVVQDRPLLVGLLVLVFVALLLAFPTLKLEIEKLASRRAPGRIPERARRAWRFWQELIDCCRRFGLESDPSQTAEEFSRLVRAAAPAEGAGVVTLLRVYHGCRFGGADLSAEEELRSREMLARLPAALQSWRSARDGSGPSRR
jgi:transglutaminase-like putative cysteine protease